MTQMHTLHIAQWGLRQGNTPLEDIINNRMQPEHQPPGGLYTPPGLTSSPSFNAYDHNAGERHPVLVNGNIGITPTRRTDRLPWSITQSLNDVFAWQASEPGVLWQQAPIWLLIPHTDEQALLWAIQAHVSAYFNQKNQPYPDNLLIVEAQQHDALQHLLNDMEEFPEQRQTVIIADSLLDSDYVSQHDDIATEAGGRGRILSEVTAWVALTAQAQTSYHAELALEPLPEVSPDQLIAHCQQWLQNHDQVDEPILLHHDVPPLPKPTLREFNYSKCCLPAATMPAKAPNPKNQKEVHAFEQSVEEAQPILQQINKAALHYYLGDCGIAKTLASLVLTLTLLNESKTTSSAVLYQESTTDAYHFLIHKEV
jgi:hypothetical protein